MRKIIGNKKGIDTILAALLMVVIVVVASVMVYAWSTGLLGTLLVNPKSNEGPLTADFSGFVNCSGTTCTNATITIRNAGTTPIAIVSYYVTDSSNNQWATKAGYAGPSIAPNTAVATPIWIGSGASSVCCSYQGTANAFNNYASGYSYTVKVITAKNNPFTFTITRP